MDEKQKEQARLRKQRQRDREKVKSVTDVTKSVTLGGCDIESVTSHKDQYPALIYALTDPEKRRKLEKIHQSLKAHNVLREVRYGVAGPDFAVIGDLLEATV